MEPKEALELGRIVASRVAHRGFKDPLLDDLASAAALRAVNAPSGFEWLAARYGAIDELRKLTHDQRSARREGFQVLHYANRPELEDELVAQQLPDDLDVMEWCREARLSDVESTVVTMLVGGAMGREVAEVLNVNPRWVTEIRRRAGAKVLEAMHRDQSRV